MANEILITQEQVDAFQAATAVRRVAIDYVAGYNDNIILVDTTDGNVTITLPQARNGKEFILVKGAAGFAMNVQLSEDDKIFGSSNISVLDLGKSLRLKSIPGGYITL